MEPWFFSSITNGQGLPSDTGSSPFNTSGVRLLTSAVENYPVPPLVVCWNTHPWSTALPRPRSVSDLVPRSFVQALNRFIVFRGNKVRSVVYRVMASSQEHRLAMHCHCSWEPCTQCVVYHNIISLGACQVQRRRGRAWHLSERAGGGVPARVHCIPPSLSTYSWPYSILVTMTMTMTMSCIHNIVSIVQARI